VQNFFSKALLGTVSVAAIFDAGMNAGRGHLVRHCCIPSSNDSALSHNLSNAKSLRQFNLNFLFYRRREAGQSARLTTLISRGKPRRVEIIASNFGPWKACRRVLSDNANPQSSARGTVALQHRHFVATILLRGDRPQ